MAKDVVLALYEKFEKLISCQLQKERDRSKDNRNPNEFVCIITGFWYFIHVTIQATVLVVQVFRKFPLIIFFLY